MKPVKFSVILALMSVQIPTVGMTQHAHDHASEPAVAAEEPGQGAFAAVTEIVTLLRQDETTEWSRVDIAGLRQHLVDMADLMMKSEIEVAETDSGIRILIDLKRPENAAASRMVPAHAPVLASETRWQSAVSRKGDILIWDVGSELEAEQIKALGFFGLMATGDHHRAHHMALARGNSMH